jgi:copper chaperone CopZ
MSNSIEIKVIGMSCEHCNLRVERALEKVEGVKEVRADYKRGNAVVKLEEGAKLTVKDLIRAVNDTEIYKAEEK